MFFYTNLLLINLLICPWFCDSGDPALQYAEKYFQCGSYYDAITEYKRYIYFNRDNDGVDISSAYYKMGISYRNRKEWDQALASIDQSIKTAKTEKEQMERKIDIAVIQISRKKYSAARYVLLELENSTHDKDIKEKSVFFRGICAVYEHEWEKAKRIFEMYYQSCSDLQMISKKDDILSLLNSACQMKYKSPSLAKWLSVFIPGAGQIYCGNAADGINALAINVLAGYPMVHHFIKKKYFDSVFYYFILFRRYYKGNKYSAQKSAIQFNDTVNKKMADDILKCLAGKSRLLKWK
ncbi:MAG: tetratricopeptide repeat protein [Candidatus Aminicenantaceae bacterium]